MTNLIVAVIVQWLGLFKLRRNGFNVLMHNNLGLATKVKLCQKIKMVPSLLKQV